MALGDLPCGADLVRSPLAGPPIQCLAGGHDVAHRPHGLLDRCVGIGAVAEDEIEEVDAHPFQRAVDGLHQVLAVQGVAHVGRTLDAPIELRAEHVVAATPAQLADDTTHDRFALTGRVSLGVVEEVAAGIERRLHRFHRQVVLHLRVERHPTPERQHRDLEATSTESSIDHLLLRRFVGHGRSPSDLGGCYAGGTGRTLMPAADIAALASAMMCSPKWKILAAKTPVAPPSSIPSTRCCKLPTPPLAITGTLTFSVTAEVRSRSNPSRVPSRSIDVSRISPAPKRSARTAHPRASMSVGVRPPCR